MPDFIHGRGKCMDDIFTFAYLNRSMEEKFQYDLVMISFKDVNGSFSKKKN